MNNKYFTPITELPGDSGKSESAAAIVRYNRSTSPHKYAKNQPKQTQKDEYFQKIMTVEQLSNSIFTPIAPQQTIKKSASMLTKNKYANTENKYASFQNKYASFQNKYAPQKSNVIAKSMSTKIKKRGGIDEFIDEVVDLLFREDPFKDLSDPRSTADNLINQIQSLYEPRLGERNAESFADLQFGINTTELPKIQQQILKRIERMAKSGDSTQKTIAQNMYNALRDVSVSGKTTQSEAMKVLQDVISTVGFYQRNPGMTRRMGVNPAQRKVMLQSSNARRGLPEKSESYVERLIHGLAPKPTQNVDPATATLNWVFNNTVANWGLDWLPRVIFNRQQAGGGSGDWSSILRGSMDPDTFERTMLRLLDSSDIAPYAGAPGDRNRFLGFFPRESNVSDVDANTRLKALGLIDQDVSPGQPTIDAVRRKIDEMSQGSFKADEDLTRPLQELGTNIATLLPGNSIPEQLARNTIPKIQRLVNRYTTSRNAQMLPTKDALERFLWTTTGRLGGLGALAYGTGVNPFSIPGMVVRRAVKGNSSQNTDREKTKSPTLNPTPTPTPLASINPTPIKPKTNFTNTNTNIGGAIFSDESDKQDD